MLPWKRGSRVSGNSGADLIRGFQSPPRLPPPSVKAINVIIDFRASKGRGGCIYSLAPPSRQRSDNSFKNPDEAKEPFLGGLRRAAAAGWQPVLGTRGPGWGVSRRAGSPPSRPPGGHADSLNGLERGPGLFLPPTSGKAVFVNAYRDYPFAGTWRSQRCSRRRREPRGFSFPG